jgi:hypothetical protein
VLGTTCQPGSLSAPAGPVKGCRRFNGAIPSGRSLGRLTDRGSVWYDSGMNFCLGLLVLIGR